MSIKFLDKVLNNTTVCGLPNLSSWQKQAAIGPEALGKATMDFLNGSGLGSLL